jgi:hypothetical protein
MQRGSMPLWWLCYRRSGTIGVVIVEGPSLIHARMLAALDGIDEEAPSANKKAPDFSGAIFFRRRLRALVTDLVPLKDRAAVFGDRPLQDEMAREGGRNRAHALLGLCCRVGKGRRNHNEHRRGQGGKKHLLHDGLLRD